MREERYVVVDKRTTCGNSVFFWCWDNQGYTCDLRMAAIVTRGEAESICQHRETDVMYRYKDVLKLVQHHVDCQDLYRKPKPKKNPHTYSHLKVRG